MAAELAPHLPVRIPSPVARGAPGEGYPHEWAVYDWLGGADAASVSVDLRRAASDLAELLSALRRIEPRGGPPAKDRGGPLRRRDERTRAGIAELAGELDADAATTVWEEALAAPVWDRPPTWIHGDLDARNLLVEDGTITGSSTGARFVSAILLAT